MAALGLLWDRDTVAFYGDPAWEARVGPARACPFTQKLVEKDGVYTLRIKTQSDGTWQRPPMAFLPHRLPHRSPHPRKDVDIISGRSLKPLVTDNFILVPLRGKFEKGKTFDVVFRAKTR